jgi:inner membrane protein
VGFLLGRAYEARSGREQAVAMTTFAGLALLPDADVLGLSFGLTDHGPYGHRGYSHSLLFAAAIAGVAYWVARRWGTRPTFTAVLAFLAVCSHGILDAMTYRTRGIPFFWPIEEMRVAFPWRPIPPAPTGVGFFSRRGLEVAAVELVYFMPLIVAALSPSLATLRRWLWSLMAPFRRLLGPGMNGGLPVPATGATGDSSDSMPALAAVGPQTGGGTRAVFRLGGAIGLVAVSLVAAHLYLSQSRVVAWIEQSTQQNLAVSLMRQPEFRHLR